MSKDTYTRSEVEDFLRNLTSKIDDAYRPYTYRNNKGCRLVEDFILEMDDEEKIVEETIPINFGTLSRKIDWNELHGIIHVGYYAMQEGFEIKDTEIFQIPLSVVEKYNL